MDQFWSNQRQRINHWGWFRTLNYYLFGVAADKVGVKILSVYEYSARTALTSPLQPTFAIIESMGGWTNSDLKHLHACFDASRLQVFSEYFERGDKCAVARWAGSELACICWFETTGCYPLAVGENSAVIHSCFTLPGSRGRGVFPQTLCFTCNFLTNQPGISRIFIDCSAVNYASQRGIIKAGFTSLGIMVTACRQTWHWTKPGSSKLVKTNTVAVR
jgi:hypothetical protein